MSIAGADFVGGALMGIAGSLHCAGVCGGIASSLLLASSPAGSTTTRSSALLQSQIGRAMSYALSGALVGSGGAAFAGLLALADAQPVLRVVAAAMIIWTGCSVAGMGRGFVTFDRLMAAVMSRGRSRIIVRHPLVMGMVWGFAPCGMVYAALVNAMMTGSLTQGAQFMAGFGLGTMPAMASAAFGVSLIVKRGIRLPERATLRRMLGGSIAVLGLVSLAEPASSLASLCFGR